ncbi:MAG: hypothetical protein HY290_15995 [Planctomycetia bacterium]|nr:hypothetical protein [Planctomycetia bacterium]
MPAPLIIYPYLIDPIWVFDDERTGLKQEAFVCGASEMITRVVTEKKIPNASAGFTLIFSDQPFADCEVELSWLRRDDNQLLGGNWYRATIDGQSMDCWLCPALELYFSGAPPKLFVRAEPLPAGVDPIWHVAPNDPRQRRFVSVDDA